jgi:hypothetical protein
VKFDLCCENLLNVFCSRSGARGVLEDFPKGSLLIRTFLSEANIGGLISAVCQPALFPSDKSHKLEADGSSERDRPSLTIYAP